MKTIQLHPVSLLVGLSVGVIGLLLMSQSAVSTLPTGRVEVGPHPRDFVEIVEGVPYTVPPGKYFTLVSKHSPQNAATRLLVNGQQEWPWDSTTELPLGFTYRWGNVLEVEDNTTSITGRAWGYLSDR